MTDEQRQDFLRKYGFLPVSGGQPDADEEDDDDEGGDENDDEDEDDEDGSQNRNSSSKGKLFTQADLNRIVGQKVRSAKKKIADEIRSEITTELNKEKAKKDNDLEAQLRLAEKELADLPTLKQAVTRFAELAEERFQAALEELPEHIRLMAPDDDADALTKETWLTEKALPAAKLFAEKAKKEDGEGGEKKRVAKPGLKPRKPDDAGGADDVDETKLKAIVKRLSGTGTYQPM